MPVLTPVEPKVESVPKKAVPVRYFHNILTATDFGPSSERAFSFALGLARRYGATLNIVHALPIETVGMRSMVPIPHEMDRVLLEAEKNMTLAAREAKAAGVGNELIMERGRVSDVVIDAASHYKAEIIVVGTHGRTGLKKLALGSVAESVLRTAECPVFTVSEHAPLSPHGAPEFRTILFATDFGTASMKAWPYAVSLAEEYGARLVLLHIVPPPGTMESVPYAYEPAMYAAEELIEWRERARERGLQHLKEMIPAEVKLAHEPKFIASTEFAPGGILKAAILEHADLIVMGATRSAFAHAASHDPWTVIHTVLAEARCPVLTVSAKAEKTVKN